MKPGEASQTAQRVAAHRLGFERVSTDYGRPEADQALQADVAADVEVDTTTPIARYLRSRTGFFDRVVVGAIEDGIPQIVAVGAGYDGRSLRYAAPGVRWFELDHPDTQADKRARLARLDLDDGTVGFAPADFLLDDVVAALAAAGHDASRPTLFTCEGVAGYLPIDTLERLIRSLADAAAPGSRLAMTIAVDPADVRAGMARGALAAAVAGMGEALSSSLPRRHLFGFFADAGWDIERAVDPLGVAILSSTRNSAYVLASPAP